VRAPAIRSSTRRASRGEDDDATAPVGRRGQGGDGSDDDVQWQLFKKHHVGSWKGLWTTYDAMGDKLLETAAIVDNAELAAAEGPDGEALSPLVQVTHRIVQESVSADCPTCFDSATTREIPVAKYDTRLPEWPMKYRLKFGANGMVVGPKVLKTGISTYGMHVCLPYYQRVFVAQCGSFGVRAH
jgi:hypothetical protein